MTYYFHLIFRADILCFLVLFHTKFQCCFVLFDTKWHEMIRWSKAVFDHILKQLLIKLFILNVPFITALSYAKTAAFLNKRQPLHVPAIRIKSGKFGARI